MASSNAGTDDAADGSLGLGRAARAAALRLAAAAAGRRLRAVAVAPVAVAGRRARARRLRLAHGRLQRLGLVGALPVEVRVRAPEVTVVGGLLVDGPQQVQLLDQRARAAVERRAHRDRKS